MGAATAVVVVIITLFLPPLGVFFVAGCGVDLLINILLTVLGVFPGHIHAFYVEYVYYRNEERVERGLPTTPSPGVYSDRVNRLQHSYRAVPPPQSYGAVAPQ